MNGISYIYNEGEKRISVALLVQNIAHVNTLDSCCCREELVVCRHTIFAGYAERMVQEFEARNPGVTVHVINPGGTEAMIARLIAERTTRADIMHSGWLHGICLRKVPGHLAAS